MNRGVAMLALLLLLAACGRSNDDDVVLVMAAASLTEAFNEIEVAFERAHPGVDVQLNLAGSASLREQILQGAPADVFASANQATMQIVAAEDAVFTPQPFASNRLMLAVPAGNPAQVDSLDDLARDDLLVGLCAAGVPCGDFARDALAQAGVEASVDTNERDVRSLLTRIAADELDVGIVYATDVQASADVDGIALSNGISVDISYPIAALQDAPNSAGADDFVAFVISAEGQQVLSNWGFGSP